MKTSNIDVVCLAATLMRVQAQVSSALTVGQSGHRASIACQLNAFLSINNLTAAIKILLLALIAAIAAGSALAQNWVWTSAPHENWSSAASSSDGMKLVAVVNGGGIWASTDSGTNWTQTSAPSTNWTSVASSSDGSKLIAAASVGGIWVSTDSGTNWTQTSAPNTNWASVASSADGSRLIAGGSGNTYISTNLGAAWTPTAISNIPFVFSSTNGTKLLVINGSSIYMSTNFGITWTSNSAPIGFSAVATSSDCNKVFGVCNGCEQNYISTNSGTTWAQINTGGDQGWISAASSADGNELLEGTFAFLIWASADSGTTWAPTHTPATVWPSIAASADGTTWVALVPGGGDGGIWTWHTTVPVISSQPTSQIVPGGINVKLGVILFGVTPLSYQWQLDGTNLPGETNAMLTLTNVNLSNSGSYVLIITNRFGSIASSNALVTVFPALLTTQPASGISATNAELNGLITPGLNDTVVWLEWGTTVNYGNVTPPMDMGESSNQLYFSSLVTGLTPNTVYHCQAVASNALGIVFGGDVSFMKIGRAHV